MFVNSVICACLCYAVLLTTTVSAMDEIQPTWDIQILNEEGCLVDGEDLSIAIVLPAKESPEGTIEVNIGDERQVIDLAELQWQPDIVANQISDPITLWKYTEDTFVHRELRCRFVRRGHQPKTMVKDIRVWPKLSTLS